MDEERICPILSIGREMLHKCVKKQCMFWVETLGDEVCAIADIGYCINWIASSLEKK